MKFIKVKLKDLCTPKQWKNLPISALHENGKYKVYGANGVIGYYNEYNHEFSTLAITCRGATCGNVHITEPKSYITSNAMSLDDLDISKVDIKFLKYVLLKRGFYDVITGSAQPQITATNLNKIDLLIPEKLEDQQKIAQLLTHVEELINKREESIKLFDELTKSTFLDMFGDPYLNNKNFETSKLIDVCHKITDGVHHKPVYYESGVPFISVKDINTSYLSFDDTKFIDDEQHVKFSKRCLVEQYDILYTKVGATYGIPAIVDTDKEFSLYVSVALLKTKHEKINYVFLYNMMKSKGIKFQADKSIKGIGVPDLHLNMIREFQIIRPPRNLQDKFAEIVTQIEQTKTFYQNSLIELNNLFGSIAQKAFKGELDVSKIELILKEQEEITMAIKLDENRLLQEIKKGDFEASKYVNEHQNYDAIKDMIFKLIEDGKISQKFDDNSKKIILEAN